MACGGTMGLSDRQPGGVLVRVGEKVNEGEGRAFLLAMKKICSKYCCHAKQCINEIQYILFVILHRHATY